MPNVPDKTEQQIIWFENHLPIWAASPTTYGITTAIANELKNVTGAARAAYNAARDARQAAKSATVTQKTAVASMNGTGRDAVNTIKAFIEASGNPALWGQAGLEPPSPRGTAPAPVAPREIRAELDSEGNVNLFWKVSQPRGVSGVVYTIRRSIDGGPFVIADSVGGKTFTDSDVASGTTSVSYTVQAKRGSQVSPLSSSLTIRFGRGGAGINATIAKIEVAPTGTSTNRTPSRRAA